MLQKVYSSGLIGVDTFVVDVEIHASRGLNAFEIVGLAEAAVRESRVRVKAAIQNSGFEFPKKRITVNLAPADIKKIGATYDLPIALGILALMNVIPPKKIEQYLIFGELGLDGTIRDSSGVLPVAMSALDKKFKGVVVGMDNAVEASMVKGIETVFAPSLLALAQVLSGKAPRPLIEFKKKSREKDTSVDMFDIRGQEYAKRALEVAAAGGHNILMTGPPGSGKTMLARRLPTILPQLSDSEALETTKIYSVRGLLDHHSGLVTKRPFRAPHHTVSDTAMAGGGSIPRPGEISLAHNGVLFLDEFPEFKRNVLEVLRQPLEDKQVTIARSAMTVNYPASFMLAAAMNPCPCGYFGDSSRVCTCSPGQIERYRHKISGPLLDRIDIQIEVPTIKIDKLRSKKIGESSKEIKKRVTAARKIQFERFKDDSIHNNSMMNVRHIDKYCPISKEISGFLETAIKKMGLSMRAYHSIIKVSRTIADIAKEKSIKLTHVAEAVQYRSMDRRLF